MGGRKMKHHNILNLYINYKLHFYFTHIVPSQNIKTTFSKILRSAPSTPNPFSEVISHIFAMD